MERSEAVRPFALLLLAGTVTAAVAAGLLPRWAGTLHFVALPPLDVMADFRALLVYAPNGFVFLLGVAVSVAIRSAVLASMLGGLSGGLFRYAVRFYLVVLPLAALGAAMFYTAGAVLYYGLFWFGLIAALALLLFTAAPPWMSPLSSPKLYKGFGAAARRGFRAGTLGAYILVLTALGYLADLTAPVGPVVLVPASAVATVTAARLLHLDTGYKVLRRGLAMLTAGGLASLATVAALGPPGPPASPPPRAPLHGSIMLMSGIDSRSGKGAILEIDPHYMGWTCRQTFYFSYAGPGNGQPQRLARCPITHGAPYRREDTLRGAEELVGFLESQTRTMIPPAVVAGHSQGVWLVWKAAADGRLPNVQTIVLVGAFPSNPIPYPARDERGPGWMGRRALFLLEQAARPRGTSTFKADSPLGREWLGHPTAIKDTLARPLPGHMSALNVSSVYDLPLLPGGHRIARATNSCPIPVIHPDLPYSLEFQRNVKRFVTGRPISSCPFWRAQVGPLLRHFAAVAQTR